MYETNLLHFMLPSSNIYMWLYVLLSVNGNFDSTTFMFHYSDVLASQAVHNADVLEGILLRLWKFPLD